MLQEYYLQWEMGAQGEPGDRSHPTPQVEMRDLIAGATVHLKPRDASAAGGEELLLDCDRAEELAMPEKSAVLHLGLCPARGADETTHGTRKKKTTWSHKSKLDVPRLGPLSCCLAARWGGLVCLLHSVGPLPPKPFEQMVLLAKDTAEAFGAEMRRCLQDQADRGWRGWDGDRMGLQVDDRGGSKPSEFISKTV